MAALKAAVSLASNQTRAFEHVEVLRNRGHRDRERGCELADGLRSVREPIDDAPPGRVRERMEDRIEVLVLPARRSSA